MKLAFWFYDHVRGAWYGLRFGFRALTTDPLTGLCTRQYFHYQGLLRLERRVQKNSMVIIMFDLDRLKQVNDVLGHRVGDFLLTRFGQILRDQLRRHEDGYRVGGDEFLIFADLPGATLDWARNCAVRIQQKFSELLHNPHVHQELESLRVIVHGTRPVPIADVLKEVGVSFGLEVLEIKSERGNIEEALFRADVRMYVAKSHQLKN